MSPDDFGASFCSFAQNPVESISCSNVAWWVRLALAVGLEENSIDSLDPSRPLLYYIPITLEHLQMGWVMFFSIDPSNGVAIYEQIVRQVKFAVADGVLVPGQLLPSVRTLAMKLAINPNTIAKAFQQLQSDGVVDSLRGRGLAVRAEAVETCRIVRRTILEDRLRSAIAEALHGGLAAKEIKRLVLDQIASLDGQVATVSSEEGSL